MTVEELAVVLRRLGCPEANCGEMAVQLARRAAQLSAQTGRSHDEALAHLLKLMASGWAAQERAGSPPA